LGSPFTLKLVPISNIDIHQKIIIINKNLLNLGIKCWKHCKNTSNAQEFENNCNNNTRNYGEDAQKFIKTGWNSDYHQNSWVSFLVLFKCYFKSHPVMGTNGVFSLQPSLLLWQNPKLFWVASKHYQYISGPWTKSRLSQFKFNISRLKRPVEGRFCQVGTVHLDASARWHHTPALFLPCGQALLGSRHLRSAYLAESAF